LTKIFARYVRYIHTIFKIYIIYRIYLCLCACTILAEFKVSKFEINFPTLYSIKIHSAGFRFVASVRKDGRTTANLLGAPIEYGYSENRGGLEEGAEEEGKQNKI